MERRLLSGRAHGATAAVCQPSIDWHCRRPTAGQAGAIIRGRSRRHVCAILFSWPEEPPYRPLTNEAAEVDPETINALTRIIRLKAGEDDGVLAPREIPLSECATARFEQFRQFAHGGKDGLDGREREWWAKIPAHVLRLAGALCYLNWAFTGGAEPTAVEEGTMSAAIRLARDYFWPHARAALRQIGLSERHITARHILRWIKAAGKREVSREEVRREALGQSLTQNRHRRRSTALPAPAGCVRTPSRLAR